MENEQSNGIVLNQTSTPTGAAEPASEDMSFEAQMRRLVEGDNDGEEERAEEPREPENEPEEQEEPEPAEELYTEEQFNSLDPFEVDVEFRAYEEKRSYAIRLREHGRPLVLGLPDVRPDPAVDGVSYGRFRTLVVMVAKKDGADLEGAGVFVEKIGHLSAPQNRRKDFLEFVIFPVMSA